MLCGGGIEHGDRRADYLWTDTITRNYRDMMFFPARHSNPVGFPQLRQYAHPTSTALPHAGHFRSPS